MSADTSHLQCLCGAVREPASILAAEHYPIEVHWCHCNPCRYTTGALGNNSVRLSGKPSKSSLDACTIHIAPGGEAERHFCSTCGTRTFNHEVGSELWAACSGMIEPKALQKDRDIVSIKDHIFVGDTRDGGLATFIQSIGSKDIPCYTTWWDEGPDPTFKFNDIPQASSRAHADTDRLHASCSCGSIKLQVSPPTDTQAKDPAVARWLNSDGTKYLALNCVCRYCRLAAGFPISSNTYVMPENIHVTSQEGAEVTLFAYTSSSTETTNFDVDTHNIQAKLPTLKFDFSSPGIRRSFCGKCGASVFFERATRPQCVNIAIGILRADSGALAREWIEFDWKEVCWKEHGVVPSLVEALKKAM